ncbi:MAG: hypothetical protein DWP92_04215, partial [Armatimonadetes bacterium]
VAVGMGTDGGGNPAEILYTVDGDGRLKKWELNGTFIGDFSPGTPLDQPRQVEVHPTTNDVWIVNSRERQIVVIDQDGVEKARFGENGSGDGQFEGDPRGITISPDGTKAFVADDGNHRVQVFDASVGNEGTYIESYGGSLGEADYLVDARGLEATADGKLIVTDEWDYDLKEFTIDGTYVDSYFGATAPVGGVNSPRGLDIDSVGRIFVSDWWNQRIDRWDSDGSNAFAWGFRGTKTEPGSINFAWDVAIQPGTGRVFVANRESHEIEVFEGNGDYVTRWGVRGPADGEFEFPQGVAFAPDDTLVVTDSGNGRVQRFTIDASGTGTFSEAFGTDGSGAPGNLNLPAGIDVAEDGTVWVADTRNDRIQSYDPDTATWTVYANASGLTTFSLPWDVTVAPDDTIWVADSGRNRIVKMMTDGTSLFEASGPDMGATALNSPSSIAFGIDGIIYVSDIWNNRIIKLDENPDPPANATLPAITGIAQVGGDLSVSDGTWTSALPITFEYQWQRCDGACVDIPGENSTTYTVTSDDIGSSVTAVVTATSDVGEASEAAPPTGVIPEPPESPVNDGLPTIRELPQVGGVLSTSDGSWTGTEPITFTYQWQRCDGGCTDISGEEGSTYTVTSSDIGSSLRSVVTAHNAAGSVEAHSAPTAVVLEPPSSPVNAAPPDIYGMAKVGQQLAASYGTWTGIQPISFTYQWQRCDGGCSAIPETDSSTYTVRASDIGFSLTVVVTGTNTAGSSSATASQTDVVPLPPGGRFVDDNGNIHEAAIEAIAALGITKGCNPPVNNMFCPDDPVTRGAMAAFLNRALGLDPTGLDFFIDDEVSVFEGDINRLAAAGITLGCNPPINDRFCPDDPVTRGAMAAFLNRALGLDPTGLDFFLDDNTSVFEGDIDRLAAAGITRGCNPPTNDRYCPNSLVTRAEMATFLARALKLDT